MEGHVNCRAVVEQKLVIFLHPTTQKSHEAYYYRRDCCTFQAIFMRPLERRADTISHVSHPFNFHLVVVDCGT